MFEGINVNQLIEKWSREDKGKCSISDISDETVKANMAMLLENQEHFSKNPGMLLESKGTITTTSSQTHAGLDGAFSPIALALVRRTFPALFANNIVGVQPMSGPVGLAYALRWLYNDDGFGNEAAFDVVPEYSGYTGSNATSAGGQSGTADNGTGVSTSAGENFKLGDATSPMPELGSRIDKVAIEAKTRKLAASMSLESIQDIKAMHGVDIDKEIINVLQYEIQAELDRELVAKVKSVATSTATLNASATDGRWSQEHFANIANRIIKEANDIGTRTRRSAGNFCIVSTNIASALQALASNGRFTNNVANVNPSNTFADIGTLNGTIKVYRDTYNTDDQVVVGYKGPGVSDAGVIYSPYITGLLSRAMAQEDFTPRIGVMSRYAITNSLLGANRYYTKFNVTNIDSLF